MTKAVHSAGVAVAEQPYAAKVGSITIARSDQAKILNEWSGEKRYPPVVYFPLESIDQACLLPSDHLTHCPIKGDAGYYSIEVGGERLENAAWFYPDPLPLVADVKGYVAFYPDKVTVEKA